MWANDSPRLPGLTSDSVQYLAAAASLARLEGPKIPVASWSSPTPSTTLSHYPPGFSAAVAPFIALGFPPSRAATVVIALAGGATLGLAFMLGASLAGLAGGFSSAALIAFYPEWLRLHTAVWSEPLYVALFLGALLSMVLQPRRSGIHGLLAAACLAVRYVGASVSLLAVVVAWRGETRDRWKRLALAGLPSLCFIVGWGFFVHEEGASVRRVALNPDWSHWVAALPPLLLQWAAPAGGAVVGVLALGAVGVLLARSPVWTTSEGRRFRWLAAWAALFHVSIVVAARALADPRIPMDARMLLPLFVLAAIPIGAALGIAFSRRDRVDGVALVAVALWAVAGASTIGRGVPDLKQTGEFYTHVFWAQTVPVQWARSAAEDGMLLYSNEPELMYLVTGKPARQAPIRGDDMQAWRQAWRDRPGPLVMMNPARPVDLPGPTLLEGLPLQLVTASPEGAVFWR